MDLEKLKSIEIVLSPSETIKFIIDKSRFSTNSPLIIKNNSTFTIAYKMKSSSPKDFEIVKSEGLILPNTALTIQILYKISLESFERFHKFLLQTVPSDDLESANWKSNAVHEYKLFAKFIDIQYLEEDQSIIESEEEDIELEFEEEEKIEEEKKEELKENGILISEKVKEKENRWEWLLRKRYGKFHIILFFFLGSLLTVPLFL
jgi:hypothetical protein